MKGEPLQYKILIIGVFSFEDINKTFTVFKNTYSINKTQQYLRNIS